MFYLHVDSLHKTHHKIWNRYRPHKCSSLIEVVWFPAPPHMARWFGHSSLPVSFLNYSGRTGSRNIIRKTQNTLGCSPLDQDVQFSSVAQSCPTLCDPWIEACQAFLSITNSRSLPKLMSIQLVMPCNHLILCCPLLLLLSIFSSIRVFSNESVLRIRWPKYWSFSFSISPSNE